MDREDAWSMSMQEEEGMGIADRIMAFTQRSATRWT